MKITYCQLHTTYSVCLAADAVILADPNHLVPQVVTYRLAAEWELIYNEVSRPRNRSPVSNSDNCPQNLRSLGWVYSGATYAFVPDTRDIAQFLLLGRSFMNALEETREFERQLQHCLESCVAAIFEDAAAGDVQCNNPQPIPREAPSYVPQQTSEIAQMILHPFAPSMPQPGPPQALIQPFPPPGAPQHFPPSEVPRSCPPPETFQPCLPAEALQPLSPPEAFPPPEAFQPFPPPGVSHLSEASQPFPPPEAFRPFPPPEASQPFPPPEAFQPFPQPEAFQPFPQPKAFQRFPPPETPQAFPSPDAPGTVFPPTSHPGLAGPSTAVYQAALLSLATHPSPDVRTSQPSHDAAPASPCPSQYNMVIDLPDSEYHLEEDLGTLSDDSEIIVLS